MTLASLLQKHRDLERKRLRTEARQACAELGLGFDDRDDLLVDVDNAIDVLVDHGQDAFDRVRRRLLEAEDG